MIYSTIFTRWVRKLYTVANLKIQKKEKHRQYLKMDTYTYPKQLKKLFSIRASLTGRKFRYPKILNGVRNYQIEIYLNIIGGLFVIAFSACGSKVSSVDNSSCYKIDGDSVIYTCDNSKEADYKNATPGYDGPSNPKALNLFRPGRFDNINSPVGNMNYNSRIS